MRSKLTNGYEDCFLSRGSRRVHEYRPGTLKKIKRRVHKKHRASGKKSIMASIVDDHKAIARQMQADAPVTIEEMRDVMDKDIDNMQRSTESIKRVAPDGDDIVRTFERHVKVWQAIRDRL